MGEGFVTRVKNVDVVVVGAGPGGCAAALGLARGGAQVLVLEPRVDRTSHFAGEWLHPAGVAALDRLGVELRPPDFIRNKGFVLHPGGGQPPIPLPYEGGTAATGPHHALVRRLQDALARQTGVQLATGRRFLQLASDRQCLTDGGLVTAGLVVGADGRGSTVRRALRRDPAPLVTLSHMAGVILSHVPLPAEGFGHVFLGGPGPALAYRIAPELIRLTLDVPLSRPGPHQVRRYLEQRFTPHLPEEMATALCTCLRHGDVQWAANSFHRRADFGHGNVALVGDAAGHGHPLAAQGMTCALLDAECLAAHNSLEEYRRLRVAQSRVPERVAAAVHRVFTGQDRATAALRQSLIGRWHTAPRERARTLRLLGLEETRRTAFSGSVAGIAVGALVRAVDDEHHDLFDSLTVIGGLARWLVWLSGPRVGIPPRSPARKVALLGP
ncbi:FAD-dependent oxidoreductase [Streptomyces sp. NPDC001667]